MDAEPDLGRTISVEGYRTALADELRNDAGVGPASAGTPPSTRTSFAFPTRVSWPLSSRNTRSW